MKSSRQLPLANPDVNSDPLPGSDVQGYFGVSMFSHALWSSRTSFSKRWNQEAENMYIVSFSSVHAHDAESRTSPPEENVANKMLQMSFGHGANVIRHH